MDSSGPPVARYRRCRCCPPACPIVSSNRSRTSPRAAVSTSSIGSAAAIASVAGVHLLDRTSDASHNRSVFTIAGPAGAVSEALERLVASAVRRDRHGRPLGRASADRRGGRDPVRAARRHDDGRGRRAGPRVRRRGSRSGSTCRCTCTPRRPARSDRVKLADVRRGQYEGLKEEIAQPRPGAGFRAGADAPVGRRGRGRGAAVPHRLQHQPRLADVELAKRIARRVRESGGGLPQGPGERLLVIDGARHAGPRCR